MKQRNLYILIAICGVIVGLVLAVLAGRFMHRTSTNDYCTSCHFHPQDEQTWKQSYHYDNESGSMTECSACHLPPKGTFDYFKAKACTGMKDLWSSMTKNPEDIDWDAKGELEYATKIVYNKSCKACHVNLFPKGITDDGIIAHLYYEDNEEKYDLQCISCHLDAGHYNPSYKHSRMAGTAVTVTPGEKYESAAEVSAFEDFIETVPGTSASISMKAIPGGTFTMGSPESEPFRKAEEQQKRVTVSSFFMAETEITWDQYWAFYNETMSEGHTPPEKVYANNSRPDVDAVSGPTAPFGSPDQGWGMGSRPAITMTWYAAKTFCQWLSLKTGRTYRLPTEAEWEYAVRGGTETPYFFEGSPKKFSERGFLKNIFKPDTTLIASRVIYKANSDNRTQEPDKVAANPFGLKNMTGNVMEYCSDWYAEDAYSAIEDGAVDPKGPKKGKEHVVRGGSYLDDPADLRSASRGSTDHDAWLKTDPQNPKSIWWYSDIKGIGFRVVCEVPENIK